MSYQDFISQTEAQYGISLPNLYKRLAADGMLDWGEAGRNWYSDTFPKLLEHPPLLLVGSEFELPHTDELQEINEQLCDDSEWMSLKPEYRGKLIAFAEAGNGDYYAFDYRQEGEPCITRLYHDDDFSVVEAANLADFIFRRLLQAQADYFPEEDTFPEDYRGQLFAQLESHRPYLSAEQYEFLRQTYQKPYQKDQWGGLFMLSDEETSAAEQRFISCERLDEEFEPFDYD